MALIGVFGVGLLGHELMPDGRLLGTAQLGIILLGAGLFLPWRQGWHLAALGSAFALTVAYVVSPVATDMSAVDRGNLVLAVGMSALTSGIGHQLWQRRLRSMLEQQFALRRMSRYAQRQEAHVTELNRELNRVARRDSLTGVGNRLALDEAIAHLLDQGNRLRPLPFAMILFDIDHFKAYNDEHGHLAGDAGTRPARRDPAPRDARHRPRLPLRRRGVPAAPARRGSDRRHRRRGAGARLRPRGHGPAGVHRLGRGRAVRSGGRPGSGAAPESRRTRPFTSRSAPGATGSPPMSCRWRCSDKRSPRPEHPARTA